MSPTSPMRRIAERTCSRLSAFQLSQTKKPMPVPPESISPAIENLLSLYQALAGKTRDDVLAQIAKCVTTGPLAGRALELVGRADPRGESEYNMALGERRASSVREYLSRLGVDRAKLIESSRGKLDAMGTDENGWRRDRRVDILLQ